jgi:hypothetical protein
MKEHEAEIFTGVTLGNVLEDMYMESKSKRAQILDIVETYSKLVVTPADAINIGPIITNLLDVAVRNDDQVAKVATIAQRLIAASYRASGASSDDGFILSDAERDQLLRTAKEEFEQAKEDLDNALATQGKSGAKTPDKPDTEK